MCTVIDPEIIDLRTWSRDLVGDKDQVTMEILEMKTRAKTVLIVGLACFLLSPVVGLFSVLASMIMPAVGAFVLFSFVFLV